MKVIVAGGRYTHLSLHDKQFLDRMVKSLKITEIIHGGARGIDYDVGKWANFLGIPCTEFPADWKKYGKSAGVIRNREMAQYGDTLIAFQGGRGTDNMVITAQKLGLDVYERNR